MLVMLIKDVAEVPAEQLVDLCKGFSKEVVVSNIFSPLYGEMIQFDWNS